MVKNEKLDSDEDFQGSRWFQFRKFLNSKLPKLFEYPFKEESLHFYKKRDSEKNEDTTPPTDERISLNCFWVIEFFTPSNINNLYQGLQKLGWNDSRTPGDYPDLVTAIKMARGRAETGGSWSLNKIYRPEEKGIIGMRLHAPLPSNADFAFGRIYHISSSLTCMVLGFYLNEETKGMFEKALREPRKTKVVPIKKGVSILDPYILKRNEISKLRKGLQREICDWFKEFFPGLLASGLLEGEYPTCEFLTLNKIQPFPKVRNTSRNNKQYAELLNIDWSFEVWESTSKPGLKFTWPLAWSRKLPYHAVVSCKESAFTKEDFVHTGGRSRSALVYLTDDKFNPLFSRWALTIAVIAFERHLRKVRDSAVFKNQSRKQTRNQILKLSKLISKNIDIATFATEIEDLAKDKIYFSMDVPTLVKQKSHKKGNSKEVFEDVFRKWIGRRAKKLKQFEVSVRDFIVQYGAFLSALENLKLQKKAGVLTWFIAGLTVLLVLDAIFPNWISYFLAR